MMIDTDILKGKLEDKLMEGRWELSSCLFCDKGADIYDFEIFNYNYLLDNSKTLKDLLAGLVELSPLADDALEIAKYMTSKDFYDFKLALIYERKLCKGEENGESLISEKYSVLLIPRLFMYAFFIAEKFEVPLGAALICIIRGENN